MPNSPSPSGAHEFDGFSLYYSTSAPIYWSEDSPSHIELLIPCGEMAVELMLATEPAEHSKSFTFPQICILPENESRSFKLTNPGAFMLISLERQFVISTAHEVLLDPKWKLHGQYGIEDQVIQFVAKKLRASLGDRTAIMDLYRTTLVKLLAVHLLIGYVQANFSNQTGAKPVHTKLNAILLHIHNHLDQELKVAALAQMAELSPPHFCRIFKKSTGLSPHRYILIQRIALAKELLNNSKISLSDIALQCGFYDQSHLNLQFRNFTGFTPKAYRDNS